MVELPDTLAARERIAGEAAPTGGGLVTGTGNFRARCRVRWTGGLARSSLPIFMRLASRLVSFAAAAALWLPYAAPILCTVMLPGPAAAHETCHEPVSRPSLAPETAGTSCAIGECATALAAPVAGDWPVLAVLSSTDLPQPEPLGTIPGERLAPPTPPPQL